jgi:hypothetical protein
VPPFDPKAYEDGVLKPLRPRMPHLPHDLVTRYAVEPGMSDAALRERVETVVRLWNKHAMRAGPLGQVCKQLVREHKELEATGNPTTPEFWRRWATAHDRRVGGQVDEVVSLLTANYGPLGVITLGQARATAAEHPELTDADLQGACTKAGLRVVEPVDLPTAPGMRGPFASLTNAMAAAGVRTIPALLHPDVTSFGLLGGFTVPGTDRAPALDRAAAAARAVELEKLPDGPGVRARKEAVGMLVSEAGAGTDLAALALYHLLAEVRSRRAEGAQPVVLHGLLTRRGLVPAEAGPVAVTVFAERGVAVRDPLSDVTEMLAEGRLAAAEQVARAVSGPDGDAARAAVDRQRRRVDDLREQARADLRAGRDEQADTRLREAMALGADVPGLAEQLTTVPAAPVLGVTANPDGTGVRVAWRPATGHADDTVYRVVRGVGRDPADPDDGDEVATVSAHAAPDAGPPVGRELHYAVFARSTGGRWSRPVSAQVRVVPPVSDLRIEGDTAAVTGRWKTHPGVASVEVLRSEGAPDAPGVPVAVDANRVFRDTAVQPGVRYYYSVVACYPAPGGGPVLRAQPQVGDGSLRVQARPVTSLKVEPTTGDGPGVRLSWRQRPGVDVVVRRAATACPWEYGATLRADELDRWGAELDGPLTVRGEFVTLVATVPAGRSHLVAFALGASGAMRGQDAVVDLVDPVRQARAQRFGDDVLVTWQWPQDVTAADVRWADDPAGGARRITRQRYRDEGGCRLPGARAVRQVEVVAVIFGGDGSETAAPAVAVAVDDRPPQLTYDLQRRRHRLVGPVLCTVTVTGAEPVTGATLVLVAAPGHAMPLSAAAGVELLREPVSITPGEPLVLPEVAVPSGLRKPYWLRCFLTEPAPALLVDPPVSRLKVS